MNFSKNIDIIALVVPNIIFANKNIEIVKDENLICFLKIICYTTQIFKIKIARGQKIL